MPLATLVATNLRAARAHRSLSQQALAKKTKLSVSYISMLERGQRTPPLETLEALAKALAVAPLDLFKERSAKRPRRGKR
ncbi:MAG TPA: helix-turn-helix transcriptional regulator [Anaeromyxobacteraceae bacterium]|nr:helix-turn-helix transcriptional regulator [Anaeromyxobacteraceae bacterium]